MNDRELFMEWAAKAGYDTAHAYDTERSRWVFWNPMTADLWTAWQAATAHEREQCAVAAEKQARWIGYNAHAEAIASAIRGRAEK